MKELSIEQKAKAYDEAIKKLRSLHDDYDTVSTLIDVKEELENIFPELAESEDERIREELINAFKEATDSLYMVLTPLKREAFIAWLEKKCEQKPILDIEIPFGAKDSELEEVAYDIPKGYHAEIEDNKVVIKKGEKKSS